MVRHPTLALAWLPLPSPAANLQYYLGVCLQEYKNPESAELAEEGWRLLVAASGKLTLLQQLLPRLLAEGHRVLIFSQYVEVGAWGHAGAGTAAALRLMFCIVCWVCWRAPGAWV